MNRIKLMPLLLALAIAWSSHMLMAQTVVSDDGNGPFALLGQMVTVTSPNGGESWNGGETQNIAWSLDPAVTLVNIDYSINGGHDWTPVAANEPNDGSYAWTVPATPSLDCLVRVSDAGNAANHDVSDGAFSISASEVESVTAPDTPTGPFIGAMNVSCSFGTGGSTSSLWHDLQYKFDWGDGTDSDWLPVGTIAASHAWATPNTYQVKAKARCAVHTGVESPWSEARAITIYEVILPEVLWNTFAGAASSDEGKDIAVDGSGNIYVVGTSYASWGNPLRAHSGSSDAFVAKYNASGILLWNTFLGGANYDYGNAFAIDGSGNVIVVGSSKATWGNPIQPFGGDSIYSDAFLAKIDANGVLQWNNFNGSYNFRAVDIALGNNDDIFLLSSSATVVKYDADGIKQWTIASLFAGASSSSITTDDDGNIFLIGTINCVTYSCGGTAINPYSGGSDVFVVKYNASGVEQWHTFLGGSGGDYGCGISLDLIGNIYLTGYSSSTWGSPIIPFSGTNAAFLAKLDAAGERQWNNFLGGLGYTHGSEITIVGNEEIYLSGYSNSTWGSPISPFNGMKDALVAKLDGNGTFKWHAFFGGSGDDSASSITIDNNGNILIVGISDSSWGNPIDPFNGDDDAFIAKLGTKEFDLSVISPNGNEYWDMGSSQYITWSIVGSISAVNIDYSTDGGGSWIPVAAGAANNGAYKWMVPATLSNNCLVRVSDAANAAVFDVSNAVFTISPIRTLTIISPNGGENWISGTVQNIAWGSTGTIGNVNIDFSNNNGTSWTTLAANIANSGAFAWTIPTIPSTTCLVRISDVARDPANATAYDVSDAVFSISNISTYTISGTINSGGYPLANVVMNGLPGSPATDASGIYTATVNYSFSGTATPTLAGYTFIPANRTYSNVIADQTAQDFSALLNTYSISGSITMGGVGLANVVMNGLPGSPTTNASGFYAAAVEYNWSGTVTPTLAGYSFSPANMTYVDIIANQTDQDYGAALNINTITGTVTLDGVGLAGVVMNGLPGNPATNGSGAYTATVANSWSGTATPTFQGFVFSPSSSTYTNLTADQTTDYTAALNQSLAVTAPNSTSLWERGKTYSITWLKQGSQNDNVKIMLYKNTSTLVSTIVSSNPNVGTYDWLVPTTLATGSTYFIRVQTVDNLVSDDSDKFSVIVPTITVTAPASGMIWMRGTTMNITWTPKGTLDANVKIQLYKGSTKALDITASTPTADGIFSWSIPAAQTSASNYSIKVITLDGLVTGKSSTFSIVPGNIIVTAPAWGASWRRGFPHTITWTGQGTLNDNVKIQLFKGSSGSTIISKTTNNGSYNWTIPATQALASNYKIKVVTYDGSVAGYSGLFSITDGVGLALQAPNGNDRLTAHSDFPISWTVDPSIREVKLEYSRDNGGTFFSIADNVPNSGEYMWRVPVNFTFNGIIRLSDSNGINWLDEDGVLECLFSFNNSSQENGRQADLAVWFGTANVQSPGYGFAMVTIGREMVRMAEASQSIGPLNGGWHEARIRLDLKRDLGMLFMDGKLIMENVELYTSRNRHFEPCISIRAGGGAEANLLLGELKFQCVLLDANGNERDRHTVWSDDFSGYDGKQNVLGSCWQIIGAGAEKTAIGFEPLLGTGQALRVHTADEMPLTICKPLAIPEKVPFDISDRSFSIEMKQEEE